MRRGGASEAGAALVGAVAALAVALAWLWPALRPGILLYRDFVGVPRPVLGEAALGSVGAPRAVPLDAVTALLAPVVPVGVQQQTMLVASVALAGAGVAVLLRRHGMAAATTGAVLTAWSPYAAERLLLGQPPTLLGWAMVPWIAAATGARRRGPRLALVLLAALPAALTPWGGLVALATALVASWVRGRRRELAVVGLLGALWCSPWALAALAGATGAGERAGAPAFAVRRDGVQAVLDVLGGGGIWASGATPGSRTGPAVVIGIGLLCAAVVAVCPVRGRARGAMLAALLGPPAVALLLVTPLLEPAWAAAQDVPGVGIVRDTHRLLGLSTLAVALLVGRGVGHLVRRSGGVPGLATGVGLVALASSLTVLSVPDAPRLLHRAYRPVAFPAGWQPAVDALADRTVLVLPDQPFRRQAWAGEHPFLDPLPLAVPGRVVGSRTLTVVRDGRTYTVGRTDPAPYRMWARGDIGGLRRYGIDAVVAWRGTSGAVPAGPAGLTEEPLDGPLRVWLLGTPR